VKQTIENIVFALLPGGETSSQSELEKDVLFGLLILSAVIT
jgi:hypothetical protein